MDVLAIRKNTTGSPHKVLKAGDLFDIILIQMKGGSARPPTQADIRRLEAVKKHYGATEIVLFSWKGRQMKTKYYGITHRDEIRNLIQLRGMDPYTLDQDNDNEWEHNSSAAKYIMEGEAEPLTLEEAKSHYKRLTGKELVK